MPGFRIGGQGEGPNADVEPARSHRFKVRFDRLADLQNVSLYALSAQRPVPEFDAIKINHKQNEVYYPGKHRWNPVTIRFYEILGNESDGFAANGLGSGTTLGHLFTYWAGSRSGPLFFYSNTLNTGYGATTISIDLLDGLGNVMYGYELYNAWPMKVEPSELDYSSSNLATVTVTFKYDSAFEIDDFGPPNPGVFFD